MKHDELRAIAHNVADSMACGCSLLAGDYNVDVFGDARKSNGCISVDFLTGQVSGAGRSSIKLRGTVAALRDALARLCAERGGSIEEFRELRVDFIADQLSGWFVVFVTALRGRRSETEYGGFPGRRLKALDPLGRVRRKPVRRRTAPAD